MSFLHKIQIVILVGLGAFSIVWGQNVPAITTEVSPKEIKIGQQIKYQIKIETNQSVIFPDGQTFHPLEMVFSDAVDTFRLEEKQRLVKSYYLTQFDSGTYTIPQQKIWVGGHIFQTDSVLVQIKNVAVDTLKQPLFDIKPIISVEKPSSSAYWKWIAVIIGIVIGILLILWKLFANKKLTQEQKIALLPPFDRAILGLKNLQNSRYLLESKHKEYYSELTDIVRRYLEEEVHISATESTTDELIGKMELLLDSKKLNISQETINSFRKVLQKADLVKFAKSVPKDTEAEMDRQTIEKVVVKTKEGLPEPTLEEKMQSDFYQEEILQKKQKNQRMTRRAVWVYTAFYILFALGGWLLYRAYFSPSVAEQYLKNNNWITSTYAYPPVKITTPEVLERKKAEKNFSASFGFGNSLDDNQFAMDLLVFDMAVSSEFTQEDIDKILKIVEHEHDKQYQGKNILTQHEPYKSVQNLDGLKILGSFDREINGNSHKMGYQNYIIAAGKTIYSFHFVYPKSDEMYSISLIEKIMYSVQFVQE